MPINSDKFLFDKKNGLFYGEQFIADFNLSIIDKKTPLGPSGARGRTSYLIEASFTDGRPKRSEWTNHLKTLNLFEPFEIDDSFLSAKIWKILLSKLMQEAGQIQERIIIDSHEGLQTISGYPTNIFGEHVLCSSKLPERHEITTHHAAKQISYPDKKELSNLCKSYINLIPGVTDLLFFGTQYAVVKPFLDRLNIQCGFLLSLVAPSGCLKTTLARIYALWLNPETDQESSFCSRQRDQEILNAIDRLPGQNFLIDDLHKIPNSNESARQERRLDIVSRHVDAKSNCANVILTGETMNKMGIFSCMDRIFQIRMPDMDAVQIENLKAKVSSLSPNLMPSVAVAFAQALTSNYNKTLHDIKTFYDKNNKNQSPSGYATRSYRHALFIRMTEDLMEKYVFHPEHPSLENKEKLYSAIEKQLDLQWKELQKIRSSEENHNYIAEFYQIINTGEPYIKVFGRPTDYQESSASCLFFNDKIYITTSAIKEALFKYYKRHIPIKLVVDAFHKEGLLEEESDSRGHQKNYLGKKHYVIPLRYWINYLWRNDYSISDKDYNDYVKPYL